MKRHLLAAAAIALAATAALAYLRPGPTTTAAEPAARPRATANAAAARAPRDEGELVALGEHLVSTSGCHDCHTPWKMGDQGPEPDMSRMLSGHPESLRMPAPPEPVGPWVVAVAGTNTAWSGPWGVSFTANLTPDRDTGLGAWDRETFIRAIRTGRHMGRGRPILPPMPVPVYRNFSDEELGAIFAYLHTIPVVRNRVPEPLPPPDAAR